MATAVLTGVPSTISLAESTTGWTGDTFSLEPDVKVQGSNSVACALTNNGANEIYYTGFTAADLSAVHLRLWFNISFVSYLATTDQIQVFISDGTNTAYWTIQNPGDYAGGWSQAVIYTGNTPTSGTKPTGNSTRVGMAFTTASKPRNVPANAWFDAWYYGDGYEVTGGTSGDEIDWSHIAALDLIEAYGIVSLVDGVYFLTGDIHIGNGTTYWKESGQICVFKDLPVLSTLYRIQFGGTGTVVVTIEGGVYTAAGTQTFDLLTDAGTFSMSGKQISKYASVNINDAASDIFNCVFDGSAGQIDFNATSPDFYNNTISNGTSAVGSLIFPLDGSNIYSLLFINCDNCVVFDAGSDSTSPAFDDFTFDDEAGNYDVNNDTGAAISISLNNGSNANSYNPTGDTVTFIGASVTTQITVRDLSTGSIIVGARVLLEVTSSAAGFPYQDSVTITGTGTTATVAHTAHGLSTGDFITIRGANEDVYNGVYEVTVTGVNAYTYTTNETIGTSPATGTIIATFAFISGITDASGIISDTRVVSSDQPVAGWVRKSSASPFYQQGAITGIVDTANGFTATIQLASDE